MILKEIRKNIYLLLDQQIDLEASLPCVVIPPPPPHRWFLLGPPCPQWLPLSPQMDPDAYLSSVVAPPRWIPKPPCPQWSALLPTDGSWDPYALCGLSPPHRWFLGPPCPQWSPPPPPHRWILMLTCPLWLPKATLPSVVSPPPHGWILGPICLLWLAHIPTDGSCDLSVLCGRPPPPLPTDES